MNPNLRELLAAGNTEEVLIYLAKESKEALLLMNQYSSGKSQFRIGVIDSAEWRQVQNHINFGILEIIENIDKQYNDILAKPTTITNTSIKSSKNNKINKSKEKSIIINNLQILFYRFSVSYGKLVATFSILSGLFLLTMFFTWHFNKNPSENLKLFPVNLIDTPDIEKPILQDDFIILIIGIFSLLSGITLMTLSNLTKINKK